MKRETVGSWKLMEKCLDLDLKVSRKMVLMVLCSHYPNIFPGEARIAKEGGIGLTAAKAAIKYLEREGWISRQRRYSKSTIYTVNVERIMATPRRELRIPAVEGGLPFPGPETDSTSQRPESAGIRPSVPPPRTAGIRPSEPAQTAGIRPINSRNPATNRQDNKQVLTDNRDKPEKASRQKHTRRETDIENHASKELENEPQELYAGMEIESNDHPAPASSGDLTEDAQSALRPDCASPRQERAGVKDRGRKDIHPRQQAPATSISSPLTEPLDVSIVSTTSPGEWVDDGIIADDTEDDTQGNTIETSTCQLNGEADPGHEPEAAVTSPHQPGPESPLSKPDQPEAPPTPMPEAKPACKYKISEGPVCWFVEDKDGKTVARAPTMEQAGVTAMDMSGIPHDRFLASKSDGVFKVSDTEGGVVKIVKTCASSKEATEEAERLNKESQQAPALNPPA